MIRKFFVDIHLYGPHAIKVNWETGDNCYSLGDNVDLACCPYKYKYRAKHTLSLLVDAFPHRFVMGNHELDYYSQKFRVLDNHILLTHGDYIFWSKRKADRYRSQKPCAGFFKYWYTKIVFGWLLSKITWPISKRAKERALDLATNKRCDTIICGHWHPKKLIDIRYKGIRLIVLPRGKTVLDI